ncbi:MAG: alkaline phosphatase family protein [Promethearchaeota archaeon]
MKLLMVGFDGLEPSMIMKLPTFGKFRKKLHLLHTVPSTMTEEAWGAMYTGRPPSQINVIALSRDPDSVSTLKGIGAQTIFEALGEAGLRIGCIGMPMTFPIKNIDAFMVAGFPITAPQYRDDDEYFYPPDIKEIVLSTYYAYLWANEETPPRKEAVTFEAIDYSIERELEKITCVRQILRKLNHIDLDFLAIGFSFTDIAAHCRRIYPIDRTYKAADKVLQEIIETFGFDNLLIVSDHGLAMVPWRGKPFIENPETTHRRYGTCICVGKDLELALKRSKIKKYLKFIRKTRSRPISCILKLFRKLKRAWKYREYGILFYLLSSIDITDVYSLIAKVFGLPQKSKLVKQEGEYTEDELRSIKNQLELLGYM